MTIAAIDKQLYSYIEQLNTAQKRSLLGFIKTIIPAKEEEYTIEQYNRELEEADAAIDRGEFYTHEEATALIKDLIHAAK